MLLSFTLHQRNIYTGILDLDTNQRKPNVQYYMKIYLHNFFVHS